MPKAYPVRQQPSLLDAKLALRHQAHRVADVDALSAVIRRYPLPATVLAVVGGGVAARVLPEVVRLIRAEPQWVALMARYLLRVRCR